MKKIIFILALFCFFTGNSSFGQAIDQQSTAAQPGKVASQSLVTDQIRSINYSLGVFIVEAADQDYYRYIKAEVVVSFKWVNDEPLKKNDSRLKELVTAFFKGTTCLKAREDYITRTLHKDIQKVIETELEKSSPENFKIKTVLIPAFFIN